MVGGSGPSGSLDERVKKQAAAFAHTAYRVRVDLRPDVRSEGDRTERDGAVGTGGQVWCDGLAGGGAVAVGLVGVYGCRWERGEARVGEAVGMSARCAGVEDGELAHFEVWREAVGPGGAVERGKVWEVMGEAAGRTGRGGGAVRVRVAGGVRDGDRRSATRREVSRRSRRAFPGMGRGLWRRGQRV